MLTSRLSILWRWVNHGQAKLGIQSTLLHCTVSQCTALHSIRVSCTASYFTELYPTAHHCTSLHHWPAICEKKMPNIHSTRPFNRYIQLPFIMHYITASLTSCTGGQHCLNTCLQERAHQNRNEVCQLLGGEKIQEVDPGIREVTIHKENMHKNPGKFCINLRRI